VVHQTVDYDLGGLLDYYADAYCGAMISGAGGGGYVIVVANRDVPGSLRLSVRMQ
jgi:mevalonate kinase